MDIACPEMLPYRSSCPLKGKCSTIHVLGRYVLERDPLCSFCPCPIERSKVYVHFRTCVHFRFTSEFSLR